MLAHLALRASLMALALGATVPAVALSPQDIGQRAERHIAELLGAQAQAEALVDRLAAAVRNEARDDVWAESKERELRRSYSDNQPRAEATLGDIDCRRAKCAVDVDLGSGLSGDVLAKRAFAVEHWIAWSQPCEFTLARQPTASRMRIFLDCAR
jgi:hypothetical protein